MEFCRLRDYGLVREILTDPTIYPTAGDDFVPPVEEFEVNTHPDIHYVLAHTAWPGLVGLFSLIPINRVCYDLHAVMLPWASSQEKWEAARQLPAWLARHSECKRLVAAVPSNHWRALIYGTHGIGMRYVGRQQGAFMKGGKLQDLVLLGLSIGDGAVA